MGMFTRLSNCANRTILYDMYSYVWDIKSIMSMVKSFVQWLGRYARNNLFSSNILSLKKNYPIGRKTFRELVNFQIFFSSLPGFLSKVGTVGELRCASLNDYIKHIIFLPWANSA